MSRDPAAPTTRISVEDLQWLVGVAGRMGVARTLHELALRCEEVLARFAVVEYDGLYLWDFRTSPPVLRLLYAHGFSEEERLVAEQTALERHPGWVVRTGEALWVPDTRLTSPDSPSKNSPRRTEMRSRLWLPVAKDGEVFGAFGIASAVPDAFDERDREILTFVAELAGIAYPRLRAEHSRHEQPIFS